MTTPFPSSTPSLTDLHMTADRLRALTFAIAALDNEGPAFSDAVSGLIEVAHDLADRLCDDIGARLDAEGRSAAA